MAKRKYNDTFLDYGFTFIEKGDEQLPQCVICFKTLSNASMKTYQLKQHFSNIHPQFSGKNRSFFEMKASSLKKMKMDSAGQFQTQSNAILTASYEVSLQVAKAKKPHNIAETLIKPCLVECAGILFGESAKSKINQVSLSNNTVKSRIADMACDIKSQLIENIKASPVFGIQLNESVDCANLSQLMVFVCYIRNKTIEEDFLFCRPLETTTKASDVLKLVEDFFTEENLDWAKLGSVCTDGAPAMLGVRSGFLALVKQKNPNVIGMHCIIHREALASRTMPQSLKQTLDYAIKVVNYIKSSALNARLFGKLCHDLGAEYESLLFHTSVRWLSRGNMLIRLVRLLPEVIEFLEIQHKQELKTNISDAMFQIRLAYLADMFSHLNSLNLKLQGVDVNILGLRDKIAAFTAKLKLWKTKMQSGQKVESFPMMSKSSETNSSNTIIQDEAVEHLNSLIKEFHRYFPDVECDTPLMTFTRNPFRVSVEDFSDQNDSSQQEFLDMIHDSTIKTSFEDESLDKFWVMMEKVYPKIAEKPLALLTMFPSTYLCESTFSSVVAVKTKARNKLQDLEADLRCAISKITPRISSIVGKK